MAKQRFGINDGYRGTVGTVIGYQWRGKWCLRSRPRFVHNPRTPKQMAARGLFALVSQLASQMRSALRLGMHNEALKVHRTECNHFMSLNAACFSLSNNQLQVDYENLLIAVGPVAPVGFEAPILPSVETRPAASLHPSLRAETRQDASLPEIVVPFEKNPLHLSSSSDDEVYLYAWCPAMDEGLLSVPAYRRTRQVKITLPDRWAGHEVHLYGFVTDYAGRASASTYIGCMAFGESDNLHSSYNKKAVSALAMENTDNHHTYETSNISGPYTGIRRNADGSSSAEGSQSDARGYPSGGPQFSDLHRN